MNREMHHALWAVLAGTALHVFLFNGLPHLVWFATVFVTVSVPYLMWEMITHPAGNLVLGVVVLYLALIIRSSYVRDPNGTPRGRPVFRHDQVRDHLDKRERLDRDVL